MCQWQMRVRGVRVLGRQVYLNDDGSVRLSYDGPAVPLAEAVADMSKEKATLLCDAVLDIHARIRAGEIDVNKYERKRVTRQEAADIDAAADTEERNTLLLGQALRPTIPDGGYQPVGFHRQAALDAVAEDTGNHWEHDGGV